MGSEMCIRDRQGSSVAETSAALEEMSVMIRSTADNAEKAKAFAQQARTAARRTGCRNDLRQLGIAIHAHHDVRRAFPFASGRPRRGTVDHLESAPVDGAGFVRPQSWAIAILPYIEEGALAAMYDRFCLACPPESQEDDIVNATIRAYNARSGVPGGLDFAALLGAGPALPDPVHRIDRWYFPAAVSPAEFSGVMVPEGLGWDDGAGTYATAIKDRPVRMAEVSDGLGNTLAMVESGDYSVDDGGSWTPSRYSWPHVSDVGRFAGRGAGTGASSLETSLKPRSRIDGGVLLALAGDGAVRSLEEAIPADVLTRLTTRAGGERE